MIETFQKRIKGFNLLKHLQKIEKDFNLINKHKRYDYITRKEELKEYTLYRLNRKELN